MIIEAVVGFVVNAVTGVLTFILPTDGNPGALGSVVGGIVPYYAWLDSWLPLTEAVNLAQLSLQITLVVGGIYVANWVLTKLHILGGTS